MMKINLMDQRNGKPTLLLVNDDIWLLNMVTDFLEEFFDVTTANNGFEALDAVIAQPKNFFDVIILDLNMPIMGGFEACEKIVQHMNAMPVIQEIY